jgi:pilus assembly protein CpaB
MNRNARTALVVVIAIVTAAVASFGVYLAVRSIPQRTVEVAQMKTVVAARPLAMGTMVKAEDLKVIPWPAANPIPGSFTATDQVVNRGVIAAVNENEPLTEAKLAKVGAGAGLPPTIPEGMRALSVKVNEVVGVAGFVTPGTRVDVLLSIDQQGGEAITRVVVSNVQVLAAGRSYDQERAQQEGKPIPTSVVTLLVTPEDAEKVTLAADEGKITLTLRNPLDQAPTETQGIRRAALLGPPAPAPVVKQVAGRQVVRAAAPPVPQAPPRYTVETIRAAKRGEETISQ